MTQTARPISDVSSGLWRPTPATPTTLWDKLDEGVADDGTTYIEVTGVSTCEVLLAALTDPQNNINHTYTFRARVTSGSGAAEKLTVSLWEGGTQRAALVQNISRTAFTNYSFTLSAAQADAITDYTNLRLRFVSDQGALEVMRVTQAFFTVDDAPSGDRSLQLSFAEEEVPTAPRRLQLSFAESEVPTAPRRLQLSFAESEAPTAPRKLQLSFAESEVPNAPTNDRRLLLSFAESEAPTAPRRLQLSYAESEAPNAPRRLQFSFGEFEAPSVPRRLQLSFGEWEVPTAPRRLQASFAEFELPLSPRRLQMSWGELQVPNVGGEAGQPAHHSRLMNLWVKGILRRPR